MKKSLLAISLMTVGCLYGILAAIIILVFILTDLPVTTGILISIGIIVVQFLIAPWVNDLVFKWFYKVKFDCELPSYLVEFIKETCNKYDMKYPKMGFIDDGSPNAFTYGRTKNDARVVITRGILDLLNEEEVKAVVAHELGHAVHYDMLFMTVVQLVPLILYYVYEFLLEKSSDSSDDDNNWRAIIGIIAYVLYVISEYIILWLSRTREYFADSFAVEETKNPKALGDALVKIGFGLSTGSSEEKSKVTRGNALGINDSKISKGIAISAYNEGTISKENIVKAMRWEMWNIWAKYNELHSTHPLISKRLLAIAKRSEEFGQEEYIQFNEVKTESYVDDFLKEICIMLAPSISLIVGITGLLIAGKDAGSWIGISGIVFAGTLFLNLQYTHKNKDYDDTTVADLLGEVKVSPLKSIPCTLKGKIIGRGNPGCIFNEDFVLKDETGIIFLDYNQPLHIFEKIFAIFKSRDYFEKEVTVKGWYRRSTAPYVEVYSFTVDGKTKYCHTYKFARTMCWIILIASVIAMFAL